MNCSSTSKIYPPLKPIRKQSTSLWNLLDTCSLTLQHLISPLSSNSALRLAQQHAQQLSSNTHSSVLVPQSYFTSFVETASLLSSSDVQTAYLSGNLFSEVLIHTPVPPHVRIPEHFTSEPSRPPTLILLTLLYVLTVLLFTTQNTILVLLLLQNILLQLTILYQTKDRNQTSEDSQTLI